MKVCTDSCLFGAWAAHWLSKNSTQLKRILDIGSGTGLLSLMLAQQLPLIKIDAVELNADAALQAGENLTSSPWHGRLYIHQTRIQNFYSNCKYDFIICNPPFYRSNLQSGDETKNAAHHSTELSLQELMIAIQRWLTDDGCFALLLPHYRVNEIEKLASAAGFFLHKKTLVKQTEQHQYFRSMMLFSTKEGLCSADEIVIKNSLNQYTGAFRFLLKDYYLHL